MGLWLVAAGMHGLMAVAMGAFAAHGLRATLDATALDWIETGSRYQMWHALALLGVALLSVERHGGQRSALLRAVGSAFFVGALLFAGGLYLLALTAVRAFAWIAPVGGVALLAGWVGLILYGISCWRRGAPS